MYVNPNTNVHILKNVPLDNTYRNTIYFSTAAQQASYFASLSKFSLTEYTYQRIDKTINVGINAESLYDCNYIMFQNASFGNKWFYAFITGVEYKGNNCSTITYEMDVMQTWFFDYTVNPCFVEREHILVDEIGANLVEENLELGEYIYDTAFRTEHMDDYVVVVAATVDAQGNVGTSTGGYGGIYSGCWLHVFENFPAVAVFIDNLITNNKADAIVSVFMMPSDFTTAMGAPARNYVVERDKQRGAIDGYVPMNNKLFTYPYCFLYVTNLMGNSAVYKYEYFQTANCTFNLGMDMSPNPLGMLTPLGYKNVGANYNEALTIGGFPQCSFTVDTYKAWLAQNGSSMAVDMLGSAMGAVAGVATGGPIGLVGGIAGATNVGRTLARLNAIQTQPPQSHGSQSNSAQVAFSIKDFYFLNYHIRAEFAKIIDQYFNVYGYATHQVKVPNRSQRPHWNYVKTVNSNLTGSVPADDMAKLRGIYDNGITFWKNGSEVGNYSLDNRAGGGGS